MSGAPDINWPALLDCTDRGPRSNLSNAVLVLQHDPQFSPEQLWYDEFLDRVLTLGVGSVPREWRDTDDARVTVYLQQAINMTSIAETVTASAVRYVAHQRTRHCVREWLASLVWDEVNRLEHALEDYWGCVPNETQPCDYLRAVSASFLLSMVARIMKPGCQVDTMLIFEGAQGIGKSRALRVLGGDWYVLASESVTSKDFFQLFPGALVVEIGEMDSFSRAERERTKIVISTPTDRYRPTYARHARDFPRQCVFAGTTNRDDYGNDDTGLRRFLPVRCGEIDIPGLIAARPQLFAEAYRRIVAGEAWWIVPDVATKAVQRDRQHDDAWTHVVLTYVEFRDETTSADVLVNALKMDIADIKRDHQNRVSAILTLHGWKRQTVRFIGKPVKGFKKHAE